MGASSAAVTANTSFQAHINTLVTDLRDQDHWASLDAKDLLLLLYHGVSTYGVTNDESMVPLLMPVYAYAMEITETSARMEMYSAVVRLVEAGSVSINAYMPFLLQEQEAAIVSTATIDLAMTGYPQDDDELAWPRAIVSYLEQGLPTNRGAVLGGLVALGDRRVNALLDDFKWTLPASDIDTAAWARTGFPTIAAFEFWLSWCEEMLDKRLGDTAEFGGCASALILLRKEIQSQSFTDVERNFGYVHDGEDSPSGRVIEELSIQGVAARFAERLFALEAAEPAPKLFSNILCQYGLEPRAALGTRYVIQ